MIKILGFSLYGSLAASHRVRLSHYRTSLLSSQINLHINSLLPNSYLLSSFTKGFINPIPILISYINRVRICLLEASNYDICLLYAELLPLFPYFVERLLLSKIPYVLDMDDSFYLKYRSGRLSFLRFIYADKIDCLIRNARYVIVANDYLYNYVLKINRNVCIIPSSIDTSHLFPLKSPNKVRSNFTIGWIGSPSTMKYLSIVYEALSKLGEILDVTLIIIGGFSVSIPNVRVENIDWSYEYENSLINSFDVGIMPLSSDDWSKGKSAFKLLQYMACGLPVVASPIGMNLSVVSLDSGYLASNTIEWYESLKCLALDPKLRERMGRIGLRRIISDYSLSCSSGKLSSLIYSIL